MVIHDILALLAVLTFYNGITSAEQTCGFKGQCEYNVVVGHCNNTTHTRTVRDSACSCSDLNTVEGGTDALSSVVQKIQREFQSVSTELVTKFNDLQKQKAQLQSLQQENSNLHAKILSAEQSTNASKKRLETEKQQGTSEIARLTSAVSLTVDALSSCNATLVASQTQGSSSNTGSSNSHLTYCAFEDSNICGYTREGSASSWSRGQSSADTKTGPRADHTYGSPSGHYMFLDASHLASSSSSLKTVRMTSPLLSPSTGYCLRFWYNMFGNDTETLKVYAKISGGHGLGNPVLTHTGQVDRDWHIAEVSLDAEYTAHSFSFVFEATTHAKKTYHYSSGRSYYSYTGDKGDIAVDDIYIYNTSCRHNDITTCPAGSHVYRNTTCYLVHVVPATWYEAAKVCKKDNANAHLVSVSSAEEQMYLIHLINADQGLKTIGQNGFYTSGNDERVEGQFEWTDQGTHYPVTYTDWHSGQPNNVGGDQNCLLLQYADSDYQWGDVGCTEKHPFICEINH